MRIVAGIFILFVIVLVIAMVRRQQLREKYAILWLVLGLATLVLAFFPGLLAWASDLLHIQVPSNLLFALTLVLVIGVCMHLSWELSRSEDRTRRLAEEVAILRTQFELSSVSDSAQDVPREEG